MWDFLIRNKQTGEIQIIFGYSYSNALARENYNKEDWVLLSESYDDDKE